MSEDFFTRSAISGGYFARTFIVYEKQGQNINSLIYPLEDDINYTSAAEYLKELAKLAGPFMPLAYREKTDSHRFKKIKRGKRGNREVWFNEVGIVFDDWYEEFSEIKRVTEYRDETGTMNRFDASVMKIAMLLSLAQKPELIITEEAMRIAITECEKLLGNVRKTTMGKQGISQSALLKSLIIMELLNREQHQVSRQLLMKKMWANYESATEFDDIMAGFEASGMIKTESIGNQIIYRMPESQASEMKQFMSGKNKEKE
jgi:hypothetical protein